MENVEEIPPLHLCPNFSAKDTRKLEEGNFSFIYFLGRSTWQCFTMLELGRNFGYWTKTLLIFFESALICNENLRDCRTEGNSLPLPCSYRNFQNTSDIQTNSSETRICLSSQWITNVTLRKLFPPNDEFRNKWNKFGQAVRQSLHGQDNHFLEKDRKFFEILAKFSVRPSSSPRNEFHYPKTVDIATDNNKS